MLQAVAKQLIGLSSLSPSIMKHVSIKNYGIYKDQPTTSKPLSIILTSTLKILKPNFSSSIKLKSITWKKFSNLQPMFEKNKIMLSIIYNSVQSTPKSKSINCQSILPNQPSKSWRKSAKLASSLKIVSPVLKPFLICLKKYFNRKISSKI